MIIDSQGNINLQSPIRNTISRVELYNSSALVRRFYASENLKGYTIERVGDNTKFFGYGVCHKISIYLIDKDRAINYITTDNYFKVQASNQGNLNNILPNVYVTELDRDENTNELTITAYDKLYGLTNHIYNEVHNEGFNSTNDIIAAIGAFIGISEYVLPPINLEFGLNKPNLSGSENLREVLNAIAEVTQTIYFIDYKNRLVFKRLDVNGASVYTIDKNNYMELDSKTDRKLTNIASVTELGDNISTNSGESGTTQYIRDNPFWDLREDRAELVENALEAVYGLTINQFECKWRGNYLIEIGDKISLITKDNNTITSYLLDDVLEFTGGLNQSTRWSYEDGAETESNPSTLGDALKQTYARVDKANKEIALIVDDVSQLKIDSGGIKATVEATSKALADEIEEVNKKAELAINEEEVIIAIQTELKDGVKKVTTETGFTFNEEGLTITKENSEISTTITEDGMTIHRNDNEILKADNLGVKAEDLHATTYLIIGNNSRFEDYDSNRTGCFWIGN